MISMIVMKIHFWTELDQVSGNVFDCFEMDEKQNQSPFFANQKISNLIIILLFSEKWPTYLVILFLCFLLYV